MKVLIIVAVLLFSSGCDFGKGRYTATASAERVGVFILDTKKGHLWAADLGGIYYIGQPKVGEDVMRKKK